MCGGNSSMVAWHPPERTRVVQAGVRRASAFAHATAGTGGDTLPRPLPPFRSLQGGATPAILHHMVCIKSYKLNRRWDVSLWVATGCPASRDGGARRVRCLRAGRGSQTASAVGLAVRISLLNVFRSYYTLSTVWAAATQRWC
jgi:hypothetical protein